MWDAEKVIEEIRTLPDEGRRTINGWLARGDGVAIYRNEEIGHPDGGRLQFVSYGSKRAQLETDEPPVQMPDLGARINWRYRLVGIYRGEQVASL